MTVKVFRTITTSTTRAFLSISLHIITLLTHNSKWWSTDTNTIYYIKCTTSHNVLWKLNIQRICLVQQHTRTELHWRTESQSIMWLLTDWTQISIQLTPEILSDSTAGVESILCMSHAAFMASTDVIWSNGLRSHTFPFDAEKNILSWIQELRVRW